MTEEQAKERLKNMAEDGASYIRIGHMTYRNSHEEQDFYVSFEKNDKWYSGVGPTWGDAFDDLNKAISGESHE